MIENFWHYYNIVYNIAFAIIIPLLLLIYSIATMIWFYGVLKVGIWFRTKTFIKQCFCDHNMQPDHDIGYIWSCHKCGYWYNRSRTG